MLSAFLSEYPLEKLLRKEDAFSFFPSAEDHIAWESLTPAHRKAIKDLAEQYKAAPYPLRKATDFLAFVRSGSRRADEDPYFFRRRKLCASVLACCLDDQMDLDDVIDGIWCLCEETAWVISAHNVNPIPGAPAARDYPLPDADKPYIDLFSAQTGMILTLTAQLLGARLDAVTPIITERIRREIHRRILTPFMENDDFWWMGFRRKDLNNWTPWIVSNIMLCACGLPMAHEARSALLDRACRMLDRWLDVVPPDGGCDEGAGYWNMAGGALLDCLEILEAVTDGKMTFWDNEKLKNILSFPLKAELGGGWFVNFADCDARPFLSGERLQFAGEKLGDPVLTAMGGRLRGELADQLNDVPHFTRLLKLLFHPAAEARMAAGPADIWLPDLQVRVARRGGFTLCCKGGNNGENHNHNDVGSFMLYLDGLPQIVDAGNMTYTAKTFSGERYTLWNTRAAYHNLPLIEEAEQRPGKEFAAKNVRRLPDGMALDLAGAYGKEAGVSRLEREMKLTENGLTLRDQIQLREEKNVAWVFMLRNQPQFFPGGFTAGKLSAEYPENLQAEVEEIPVTDPRMARNFPGSLWRVKLTAEAAESFEAMFLFSRQD